MTMSESFRKYRMVSCVLCLMAVPLFLSVFGGGRKVVGQVVLVGGDLSVSGHNAASGTTLFDGDSVATGANPAILALNDGTRVQLEDHSEAQLSAQGGKLLVLPRSGVIRKSTDLRRADISARPIGAAQIARTQVASPNAVGGSSTGSTTIKLAITSQGKITAQAATGGCPPNQPHCL